MRGNSNFVGSTKTQQNCLKQDVVLLNSEQINKGLIRLRGCTGCSVPLLFAATKSHFLELRLIDTNRQEMNCWTNEGSQPIT